MMNQLARQPRPAHLVKFTDSVGNYSFYLDTSRMDSLGECPVVVYGPMEEGRVVADSFLDFLRKAQKQTI